ncbi:hypothetical protein EJP82_18130 [Paenibacillus anaericanus]|uniref:CYTH domain-containing protein n=1 Tax=Paenibacillus anaericanus TaxID=170367 RepID=A0A3S1DGS3_9BACL|nr:hypothetical protein [Paenibacillus anaericanus]RUT44530.1 hypothetical protein EJP82_18130 [Paenibacillus anaericanus]
METLFSGYGIEIIERDKKLFIQYDAGEIVDLMIEVEVTEDESIKAQKSDTDAYEVIIKLQNEKRPYNKLNY